MIDAEGLHSGSSRGAKRQCLEGGWFRKKDCSPVNSLPAHSGKEIARMRPGTHLELLELLQGDKEKKVNGCCLRGGDVALQG